MKVWANVFGAEAIPESQVSGICERVVVCGPLIHCHSTVSPTWIVTVAGENVSEPPGPTCTVFVAAAAAVPESRIAAPPILRSEVMVRLLPPAPAASRTPPPRSAHPDSTASGGVAERPTRGHP